jgi:hypothetical protein
MQSAPGSVCRLRGDQPEHGDGGLHKSALRRGWNPGTEACVAQLGLHVDTRTSFLLLLSDGKAHHQRNRHIDVDRHTNLLVSLSRLLYQVGAFRNPQGEAFSLNPGHVACEICFAQPVDDAQKYTPRRK